jgi:SAM-dependent methyltransferase
MRGERSDAVPPAVGRHYRGELAEAYFGWQRQGGRLSAEIERSKFAHVVGPGDVLVDFGCGAAHLLEVLPARERRGIEPSEPARREAIARGVEVVASTHDLPDAYADVVISNHALEHTLAPWHELRELHRILKPGGRLALWLPLDDWRTQRRRRDDVNHHLYTWTPVLLANLLEEAGFELRESRVVTHAWPQFHEVLFQWLPRRAFDALARAWAFATRHRQLVALAVRPADQPRRSSDSS